MFGSPDVSVPRGFGVHVTPATVDRHLLDQCRELRSIRRTYRLSELNMTFIRSCDAAAVAP